MQTSEKQQEQQRELHSKLWAIANDLRGNMEANEFKNYILGMIFYRYLSDKTVVYMDKLLKDDDVNYEEAFKDDEYKNDLIEEMLETLGYVIEPDYLFAKMVYKVENNEFDIEYLHSAINSLMESTLGTASQYAFEGLFDDMDLSSTKLGKDVATRSKLMAKIVVAIDAIEFDVQETQIDVLGDAYEYLIGQFAANAGKKAGEFYTPAGPAELLCRLATVGVKDVLSAADPTCGSGSLLLRLNKYANVRTFYGQEITSTTYNLARMNMILHNVPYQNFQIYNGDTLEDDNFEEKKFLIQVANPPYSAKWSAAQGFLNDSRFSDYGVLAPKSKADYAFLLHGYYHLKNSGTMAIILPHGVLFRGAAEGKIRQKLIDNGAIYAVIGLPSNLFYNTSIPTTIIVLKKNREGRDVLFIDASNHFVKKKTQNEMSQENIDHVIQIYTDRKDVEKEAHIASYEEIKANDYNLNIPRYVDTFEQEEEISLADIAAELLEQDSEIKAAQSDFMAQFAELSATDAQVNDEITQLMKTLEGLF